MIVKRLQIQNPDATPSLISMMISPEAIRPVLLWYAGYHAGDTFTILIDGENTEVDHNGEIV